MAQFKPMAGHTYTVIFEYDSPRYSEASKKEIVKDGVKKLVDFSENWSYGVFVDGSQERAYWNIYDKQVVATIESMGTILKGIPIQVIPKQEMGSRNRPFNTYQFIKENVSYYTQQTEAQPVAQDKPFPTAGETYTIDQIPTIQPPDVTEELDKRKRLMKWCIEAVCGMVLGETTEKHPLQFSDIVPLIQSLHVEIRDKNIYPPKPMTSEDLNEMIKNNPPLPEAEDIHGHKPEDLEFLKE